MRERREKRIGQRQNSDRVIKNDLSAGYTRNATEGRRCPKTESRKKSSTTHYCAPADRLDIGPMVQYCSSQNSRLATTSSQSFVSIEKQTKGHLDVS